MTEQKNQNGPFIGFPWTGACPNAIFHKALPCLRHPGYIAYAREGVDWAQVQLMVFGSVILGSQNVYTWIWELHNQSGLLP